MIDHPRSTFSADTVGNKCLVLIFPAEMESGKTQFEKVSFGVFEANFRTGELTKFGVRVRIQSQPFKVLSVLLERPNELVSREELRQRLWSDGTVVDFDHGLATAINKIREVLGDSAENPRFVETLSRRGYRFIAPVRSESEPEIVVSQTTAAEKPSAEHIDGVEEQETPEKTLQPRSVILYLGMVALAFVCVGVLWRVWNEISPPRPLRIRQVTWSGHVFPGDVGVESFPGLVTDGTRMYFSEVRDGRFILAHTQFADNEIHSLPTFSEIAGPSIADISTDGSKLLVRNHLSPEVEQPLWVIPSAGNAALRVLNVLAHDATWMPDGQSILYAAGHDLFVTRNDGRESQKFASLSGRAFWLRWSPDGKRLRFTLLDPQTRTPSLWEMTNNGGAPHPLLAAWHGPAGECCGSWTPDGTHFLFQAMNEGRSDIWTLPESGVAGWFFHRPRRITDGPMSYSAPVALHDASRIFVVGAHTRSQLFRYDSHAKQLLRYLPEVTTAARAEFSRDGKRVAWISNNGGGLWASQIDGSQRLQLTAPPMEIYMMSWSPDGASIAFMGREPAHPWKIYVVANTGASTKMLLNESQNEADPSWSPDGRFIAFGRLPAYMSEDATKKRISIVDIKSGAQSELPHSEGLFSPRWSPDGRYLAAITADQRKLMICDMSTHSWTEIPASSVDNPVWSSDSGSVYFHSFMEEGLPIYRLAVASGELERVFEFSDVQIADAADYSFQGLAPDNSPLLSVRLWTADVYSLSRDDH